MRKNVKVEIVGRLADGSALMEVPVQARENSREVEATLRLREIRTEGMGPGRFTLRLWTNLLDPSVELAALALAVIA